MKPMILHMLGVLLTVCVIGCDASGNRHAGDQSHDGLERADSLCASAPLVADSLYRCVVRDSMHARPINLAHARIGLAEIERQRGNLEASDSLLHLVVPDTGAWNGTSLPWLHLLTRGRVSRDLGDSEAAIQALKRGHALAGAGNDAALRHTLLLELSRLYMRLGRFPDAVAALTAELAWEEKAGDERHQIAILADLAMALKETWEVDEAVRYMTRSLEISARLGLIRELASGQNYMGNILAFTDKDDSALAWYQRSLATWLSIGDSLNIIKVRYGISNIMVRMKRFDEAEQQLREISIYCLRHDIADGTAFSLSALAHLLNETHRSDEGLVAIDTAIAVAERHQLIMNLSGLHRIRGRLLNALGRSAEGYTATLAAQTLADSLLGLEQQKEIAHLRTRFETQRREAVNAALRKDNEIQASRIWLLVATLILGFSIFIGVMVISHFRQKHLKHQRLLADERSKRAELERNLKEQELAASERERVLISHEVKERRKAEEEIRSKNSELQIINMQKDMLFSIISHDLRSPFTALLGYSDLLVEELPSMDREELLKYAHGLQSSVANTHGLIENLLGWSRLERGSIACTLGRLDLHTTAEDVLELVRHMAEKKHLVVSNDIPLATVVKADPMMVSAILRNLLTNAIKFSRRDGIITISAAPSGGAWLEVRVSDSGIGMPGWMLHRLFTIDGETSRPGTAGESSTGLGLVICREFVEMHGGTISVTSEENVGTSFRFSLPALPD